VGQLRARGFNLVPDSPRGHYLLTIPTPPADNDWDALQQEFGDPEQTPSREEVQMLILTVDFNALAGGLVRGRAANAAEGPNHLAEGSLALLTDGEGNEALGTVRKVRDGLVFAAVEWDTWGPTGTIKVVSLPPPRPQTTRKVKVTGSVWQAGTGDKVPARVQQVAERVPIPA